MLWIRMIAVAWRLAWPYMLTPWRSPLLRWRMETYGILDERGVPLTAHAIGPREFFQFACSNRLALWRFLRWAAEFPDDARR